MNRREFITLLGGSATVWPMGAWAQQPGRVRRIGIILPAASDDARFQSYVGAFLQGLQQAGWSIGRNVRIDTRWMAGNARDIRTHAAELATLAPDVILAHGSSTVGPMLQATRAVPIVFVQVADPVGAGYIDSLAHPGGNGTGFMSYEYSIGSKWLQLLKQMAPATMRAGVFRDPSQGPAAALFATIQAAASTLQLEVSPVNARDAGEIQRSVAEFARRPGGGLVVTSTGLAVVNRNLLIRLAAQHKLPAIYFDRVFVNEGGLICYSPDAFEVYRQAAGYVDRILKGERPADLPVQAPNKLELVVNLKTAKALGLTVPPALLASADEVIE